MCNGSIDAGATCAHPGQHCGHALDDRNVGSAFLERRTRLLRHPTADTVRPAQHLCVTGSACRRRTSVHQHVAISDPGLVHLLRSTREFFFVTAVAVLVSGLGIWIFGAGNSIHLGISGVVFGYLGYLLARGYFERSPTAIALALIALFFYGSMIWGVLPLRDGVSWLGHLFGLIGGGLAAYWVTRGTKVGSVCRHCSPCRSFSASFARSR